MVHPNPLTLTLYSDATHARDITEDLMLEEFAASLVSCRIIAWPSLEHPLSPPVAPQPQDEAPAVAGPQLEDEDLAVVVSGALRTPPPRPIH
jgi:hypothetical protein